MKSALITNTTETFYLVFQIWDDQNVFENFCTCNLKPPLMQDLTSDSIAML